MFPIALLLLASPAAAATWPFEITNNKPFVQVSVDGSPPQWFILDSGNNSPSILARECADRLGLERGAEEKAQIGAGAGAPVGLAQARRPIRLEALGETLTVVEPTVMTLGHVSRTEGRRVDGLLGADFLAKHVVALDYKGRRITVFEPTAYAPPAGAIVVPLDLATGWPVATGTLTLRGGAPIPCRVIVDTGMRGFVTLFRPFSEKHGLYDAPGSLRGLVTGAGAGGMSSGDLARLAGFTLGAATFDAPVATFSRDTMGIFALDGPDGIVGGELLRRHRVTFDCPHGRMILEPVSGVAPFEHDMSGLFLAAEAPDYAHIRVEAVNPDTPAAAAGLRVGDEIASIDNRRSPSLTLDEARALLRTPADRRLELRRDGRILRVRLAARRLV